MHPIADAAADVGSTKSRLASHFIAPQNNRRLILHLPFFLIPLLTLLNILLRILTILSDSLRSHALGILGWPKELEIVLLTTQAIPTPFH